MNHMNLIPNDEMTIDQQIAIYDRRIAALEERRSALIQRRFQDYMDARRQPLYDAIERVDAAMVEALDKVLA